MVQTTANPPFFKDVQYGDARIWGLLTSVISSETGVEGCCCALVCSKGILKTKKPPTSPRPQSLSYISCSHFCAKKRLSSRKNTIFQEFDIGAAERAKSSLQVAFFPSAFYLIYWWYKAIDWAIKFGSATRQYEETCSRHSPDFHKEIRRNLLPLEPQIKNQAIQLFLRSTLVQNS